MVYLERKKPYGIIKAISDDELEIIADALLFQVERYEEAVESGEDDDEHSIAKHIEWVRNIYEKFVEMKADDAPFGIGRGRRQRYFREHRGKFVESMKTMRKVDDVKDIQDYLNSVYPEGYLRNIRIAADTKRDHGLNLDDWGKDTYMVVADFDGYTSQCVGYANFWEEQL